MPKSIEEIIEDLVKGDLSKDKSIKYYTKTESINESKHLQKMVGKVRIFPM